MKRHSNKYYANILITLFFLIVLAKALSVMALWFLPMHPVEHSPKNSVNMPYTRVDFHNMIAYSQKSNKVSQTLNSDNAFNINTLILKALYGNKKDAYVIIALKSAPQKTSIISLGENYQGYRLEAVFLDYALFVKNGKRYKLKVSNNAGASPLYYTVQDEKNNENGQYLIQRSDINSYIKHPSAIWKDISIQEIGKNGTLKGFKVTKIRKGSKLAVVGLKVGDIIIKANNIALKSYNDVLKIYQNLHNLDTLSLVVKRANKEKEIVYEIN